LLELFSNLSATSELDLALVDLSPVVFIEEEVGSVLDVAIGSKGEEGEDNKYLFVHFLFLFERCIC